VRLWTELGFFVTLWGNPAGTSNLRVVDASVIPTMPGGQLAATVYALAERASGILLKAQAVGI
jgi:choline dehydrogenase-like flavoprotein